MATARETRGLGSGPRTVFRPVGLDGTDALFAVGTVAVAAGVVALAAVAGLLTSWGGLPRA